MSFLLSIPILLIALMLQITLVSDIALLQGTADLLLVIIIAWSLQENARSSWVWALLAGMLVAFVSATPFYIPILVYVAAAGMARLLQARIWQSPILAMFAITLVSSLLYGVATYGILAFSGANITLGESMRTIIIPSVLLNLLISLPVYTLMRDLADWVNPVRVEV